MASEAQAHTETGHGGHDAHESGHFGPEMWVIPERSGLVADVTAKSQAGSGLLRMLFYVGGALTILGIVGFVLKLATAGFSDHRAWGFYVAAFAFVFTLTASAPLAACAFRFTKSHWRRPLSRIAEIFSLVSIVNILLFIPALIALPDIGVMTTNSSGEMEQMVRRSIWFQELNNPAGWLMAAMVGLAVCSLAILWLAAMPDMAQSRGLVSGFKASLYQRLAGGWYGTKRQWQIQKAGLAILGAFYFMLVVFTQFLIVSDFAMAMIPGWKDSILPPFYTVISFQSGLAVILVMAYALAALGRLPGIHRAGALLGGEQSAAGTDPAAHLSPVRVLHHLLVRKAGGGAGDPELPDVRLVHRHLLGAAVLHLLHTVPDTGFQPCPATGLGRAIGRRVHPHRPVDVARADFRGGFRGGAGRLARAWYFLPSEAFALPALLPPAPAATFPDLWDIFMLLGGVGIVMLMFRVGTMLLPPLSMWEVKEGSMYQRVDTLIRGRYLVLAKPE